MIFHIDANSFYASCERLFRPDLDGKPIAVLSNNDGVTIALNQECKDLGFNRGDTYFKMKAQYAAKNVTVFSSNYTLYADISMRLNMIYNQFCPDVEFYSIDESFLHFPDWRNIDFTALGWELRQYVIQGTHIPVSVGIAPTKTLAKLCNKLAKKRGGVCNWAELDGDAELKATPAGDIWGIGWSKTKFLSRYGIRTALDLKSYPLDKAKKFLTITGFKTVRELNGIPSIDMTSSEKRKNITSSRSFAHGVTDMAELETALAEYTQLAVTRMRQEGSACRIVMIYLMTARAFKMDDKPNEYFCGASRELPQSTSFLPDIIEVGIMLLHSIYRKGFQYRKIMVNLFALEDDVELQGDLFEPERGAQREKKKQIMNACDTINAKFGRGMIHTGIRNQVSDIQKTGNTASWLMSRQFLSPRYTTRFSDLPDIGSRFKHGNTQSGCSPDSRSFDSQNCKHDLQSLGCRFPLDNTQIGCSPDTRSFSPKNCKPDLQELGSRFKHSNTQSGYSPDSRSFDSQNCKHDLQTIGSRFPLGKKDLKCLV